MKLTAASRLMRHIRMAAARCGIESGTHIFVVWVEAGVVKIVNYTAAYFYPIFVSLFAC